MILYRMAWQHASSGGLSIGHGPESRNLTQTLIASVAFGNRNHGSGSHWIERYENEAWTKLGEKP